MLENDFMLSLWKSPVKRAVVSTAALLASTYLYAIPSDPSMPKKNDVECDKSKPGPFAYSFPSDYDLACPVHFSVYAEGLAIQAQEDGLDLGIRSTAAILDGSPLTQGVVESFSSESHDWSWNPAFRFGIGFQMDEDAWGCLVDWTWAHTNNAISSTSSSGNSFLLPSWLYGQDLTASDSRSVIGRDADAHWYLSYNMLDIALAKPYHVSRYFVLSPHVGLRTGWIDQSFSADYTGNLLSGAQTQTVFRATNNFWGAGARMGMKTDWLIADNWSIFGHASIAMLFGKFETMQDSRIPPNIPNSSGDGSNLIFSPIQNKPNIELAMGVCWDAYFNDQKQHLGFRLGYEFVEWFDQLQLVKFFSGGPGYAHDIISRGDLTLNGVALRFQLDI
jgi:hypothetical protein